MGIHQEINSIWSKTLLGDLHDDTAVLPSLILYRMIHVFNSLDLTKRKRAHSTKPVTQY
jgi:hypothetical protein